MIARNPLHERIVVPREVDTRRGATARPVSARTSASAADEYTASLPRLAPVGRCAHVDELDIFVLDESGSITGSNDSIGRRHEEIAFVGDHMASCRCGRSLVKVIYFDPGPHDAGPFPMVRGSSALRDALMRRPGGTGSVLGPAMEVVEQTAAAYPNHEKTLVVGSDFELFDTDVARQLQRMIDFPGNTHAMVLNAAVPAVFDADGPVSVTHIRWDSPKGALAHALLPTLARHRRPLTRRKS